MSRIVATEALGEKVILTGGFLRKVNPVFQTPEGTPGEAPDVDDAGAPENLMLDPNQNQQQHQQDQQDQQDQQNQPGQDDAPGTGDPGDPLPEDQDRPPEPPPIEPEPPESGLEPEGGHPETQTPPEGPPPPGGGTADAEPPTQGSVDDRSDGSPPDEPSPQPQGTPQRGDEPSATDKNPAETDADDESLDAVSDPNSRRGPREIRLGVALREGGFTGQTITKLIEEIRQHPDGVSESVVTEGEFFDDESIQSVLDKNGFDQTLIEDILGQVNQTPSRDDDIDGEPDDDDDGPISTVDDLEAALKDADVELDQDLLDKLKDRLDNQPPPQGGPPPSPPHPDDDVPPVEPKDDDDEIEPPPGPPGAPPGPPRPGEDGGTEPPEAKLRDDPNAPRGEEMSDQEKLDAAEKLNQQLKDMVENDEAVKEAAKKADHLKDPYSDKESAPDPDSPEVVAARDHHNKNDVLDDINRKGEQSSLDDAKKALEEAGIISSEHSKTITDDRVGEGIYANAAKGIKVKAKGNWRGILQRLILQAAGSKEKWDAEQMSRKIKGALGRDVEVPDFTRISAIFDASGSIDFNEHYLPAIKHLSNMIGSGKLKNVTFDGIVFADRADYRKFPRYNEKKVQGYFTAISSAVGGGTGFMGAVKQFKRHIKKTDVILLFTDYMWDELDSWVWDMQRHRGQGKKVRNYKLDPKLTAIKMWLQKWKNKVIHCVIDTGDMSEITDYLSMLPLIGDRGYKKRSIFIS